MIVTTLPQSFIDGVRAVELTMNDVSSLQRFFADNPEYFLSTQGEPAGANSASEELQARPPAAWHFTQRWMIGYVDARDRLIGVADVVSDLLAMRVWHIGLFIVATVRHGQGDAQALYGGLEAWAQTNGAHWMRLGVVQGHVRAERFWERRGYIETRTRDGVPMGPRTNTVRVMVKPLTDGTLDDYLAMVPRDRPDRPGHVRVE
jgi:GNAT superfamily N-acetyltransferase